MKEVHIFKEPIQKIQIVHRDRGETEKKAFEVKAWLEKKGFKVKTLLQSLVEQGSDLTIDEEWKDLDLVVVLGGDGTYLSAVRNLKGKKVPVLGVNMGALGFLSHIKEEDCYSFLSLVIKKEIELRPRSMLQVDVKRGSKIRHSAVGLNDVVVERGTLSHVIRLTIESDGQEIGQFKSDGVIVSSPSGSTAYNLSAGGPILHPNVKAFICTPICPHSLTNRPIIFPEEKKLSIYLNFSKTHKSYNNNRAFLTVDGKSETLITHEDCVKVRKASFFHYVLRKPSHNYFTLLKKKLKFSE